MASTSNIDLASSVARDLPYLRRYARALTGSQTSGDRYAVAVLETVLADSAMVTGASDPKVGLFAVFHGVWSSSGAPVAEADSTLGAAAQAHLAALTPNSREALLLHTLEGFTLPQVAEIMGTDEDEATHLVDRAIAEMANTVRGRVMIIEDEAIIAMDLTAIVEGMGHDVTGIARTRAEAVALAKRDEPDMILADIQLADNSSGIDAVNDILAAIDDIPVIFITAFPERLLTGERPEPAFLINKPYTEEQVRSAVSQAMFFSSTETLNA
ncbi:response regulator [Neotabrizicola sp. VNH66]|uniref:response regulator n=1 Tax=Neotabrizicola sp. VNH66 TaxID=3400918 RepID=UPI003C1028C1